MPTFKQLEDFAKATHAPIGFLFLPKPPVEQIPIPDFRIPSNMMNSRPSPDLLDTIYLCQQRQEWYKDYAREMGDEAISFIGIATIQDEIEQTAQNIRKTLGFDLAHRRQMSTWVEALRKFIQQADSVGMLVMINGVVGNNNHRKLNPYEFRGFALVDELAPLIFVNGADTLSGKMFTLAHEIAHLWLGKTALSNAEMKLIPENETEHWCNQIAAEILVPLKQFESDYNPHHELTVEFNRLARLYKVSTLVILRRIYEIGSLSRESYWEAYEDEVRRLEGHVPSGGGGNFHWLEAVRVSRRFARALLLSTVSGNTTYRDAFKMLGITKQSTFQEFGVRLGVL